MKEVIYSFLKCLSKVGLFFKRLAVKIRSFRRFSKLIHKHNCVNGLVNDYHFMELLYDMFIDLKD